MAAGTEVTQPTCVLDGAYKGLPPDTQCNRMETGIAGDKSKCRSDNEEPGKTAPGRPPRSVTTTITKQSTSTTRLARPSCCDAAESSGEGPSSSESGNLTVGDYVPVIRSGGWTDIGHKPDMEDEHVRIDDLQEHLGPIFLGCKGGPRAYYGVFDGHDGKDAAQFVKEKLLNFIVDDVAFPTAASEAVRRAFLQTDTAFAEACSLDHELSSGTTAITALIFGRTLLVANVGDCRAVLSRKGKAVDMSRDHKPYSVSERSRIEALGGSVNDDYLNGQLGVARALGDWHLKGLKGSDGPLSAEPELQQEFLTEEDEFLIIGCDGLWDVFTSQNAVDFARRKLQQHNNPEQCSRDLVFEALRREAGDNLTVVTVCLQPHPPPRLVSNSRVRRSIFAQGLRNLQDLLDGIS